MYTDKLSISVVIPVYNREKRIKYCLNSILDQTVSPLEIVIVDDCSIDNTVHVIKSYNDRRIRLFVLDKQSGAQAARNFGIKKAIGNWFAFQDSDDEWMPDKLEKQIKALAEINFDPWTVVHTNAVWFDEKNNTRRIGKSDGVHGKEVYEELLRKPGPMFQGMVVSKKALDKIGGLDDAVPSWQEWDTSIRLSKYCQFIYLKEPLFIYYISEKDAISSNQKLYISGYKYIVNKFENEIKSKCEENVWIDHYSIMLRKSIKYGLWKTALGLFLETSLKVKKSIFMKILTS